MLIVFGDLHTDWRPLMRAACYAENATFISVGDFGMGMIDWKLEAERLLYLSRILSNGNNQLKVVRGNHDDPSIFDGRFNHCPDNTVDPNIQFLKDYTLLELEGRRILCVGGAVSIDRLESTHDVDYWPDEVFVLRPDLVQPADILITHSAPSWAGRYGNSGIVRHYSAFDPDLWDELKKERKEINDLINLCGAKQVYCGHLHQSATDKHDDVVCRILNINEFLEIR